VTLSTPRCSAGHDYTRPRTPPTSVGGPPRRMSPEPGADGRHLVLESARHRDVQNAGAHETAVLEVVGRPAGHQHERAGLGIDPLAVDEEAHRALDHVEDVVLLVGVGAGASRLRLDPPLRDRVAADGLLAVGLEDGGYATHGIAAAGPRGKYHRFALILPVGHDELPVLWPADRPVLPGPGVPPRILAAPNPACGRVARSLFTERS